jgi:hypothetical protein
MTVSHRGAICKPNIHRLSYLGWMRIIDTQKGLTVDDLLRLIAMHNERKRIFPPLMRI